MFLWKNGEPMVLSNYILSLEWKWHWFHGTNYSTIIAAETKHLCWTSLSRPYLHSLLISRSISVYSYTALENEVFFFFSLSALLHFWWLNHKAFVRKYSHKDNQNSQDVNLEWLGELLWPCVLSVDRFMRGSGTPQHEGDIFTASAGQKMCRARTCTGSLHRKWILGAIESEFRHQENRAVVSARENRAIGNVKLVYMDSSGVGSWVCEWIYVRKKGKTEHGRFYDCELSLVESGSSSHRLKVVWLCF